MGEIRNLPTAEQIRQRAYEIYLSRGSGNGNELSDWLQAQQELSEATGEQIISRVKAAVASR